MRPKQPKFYIPPLKMEDPQPIATLKKRNTTWSHLTPENVQRVKEELAKGISFLEIERTVGISRYYIRQIFDGKEVPTNGRQRPTKVPQPARKSVEKEETSQLQSVEKC